MAKNRLENITNIQYNLQTTQYKGQIKSSDLTPNNAQSVDSRALLTSSVYRYSKDFTTKANER